VIALCVGNQMIRERNTDIDEMMPKSNTRSGRTQRLLAICISTLRMWVIYYQKQIEIKKQKILVFKSQKEVLEV
jgi:hypothetical protein